MDQHVSMIQCCIGFQLPVISGLYLYSMTLLSSTYRSIVKPKRKLTQAQIEKGRQNLEKGRLIKAEKDNDIYLRYYIVILCHDIT